MQKQRRWIVLGAAILLGLTFVASGTGKLPGQAEFADALLKSFWTPTMAFLISRVLPWVELGIGAALLLELYPRIAAILSIPLTLGFMANNGWALASGIENFPDCACFGVWENYVGALSPLGSLIIDIVLLCLALAILVLDKRGFIKFQPWFIRGQKGETPP